MIRIMLYRFEERTPFSDMTPTVCLAPQSRGPMAHVDGPIKDVFYAGIKIHQLSPRHEVEPLHGDRSNTEKRTYPRE